MDSNNKNKKRFCIALQQDEDKKLCSWAKQHNITNQFNTPNRSMAISKLIKENCNSNGSET